MVGRVTTPALEVKRNSSLYTAWRLAFVVSSLASLEKFLEEMGLSKVFWTPGYVNDSPTTAPAGASRI